jgi:hypothetical protein
MLGQNLTSNAQLQCPTAVDSDAQKPPTVGLDGESLTSCSVLGPPAARKQLEGHVLPELACCWLPVASFPWVVLH